MIRCALSPSARHVQVKELFLPFWVCVRVFKDASRVDMDSDDFRCFQLILTRLSYSLVPCWIYWRNGLRDLRARARVCQLPMVCGSTLGVAQVSSRIQNVQDEHGADAFLCQFWNGLARLCIFVALENMQIHDDGSG